MRAATLTQDARQLVGEGAVDRWKRLGIFAFFTATGLLYGGIYIPRGQLQDFGSFWQAGKLANEGQNPYVAGGTTLRLMSNDSVAVAVNLDPPTSLPLFQLFARTDPHVAFTAWWLCGVALYVLTFALLWRFIPTQATPARVAWALGMQAFWASVGWGQIYVPITLSCVVAWLLLGSRRYVAAGVLLGAVAAIKTNLAVWPVLLVIGGAPIGLGLASVASFLVVCSIPVVLYGPEIYLRWLVAVHDTGMTGLLSNVSLDGLMIRLGVGQLGLVVCLTLLLGLAVWVRRTRPEMRGISGLALVASVLASPVGWANYALWLLPVLWSRRWPAQTWIAVVLLQIPGFLWWNAGMNGALWSILAGLPPTLAFLLILWDLLRSAQLIEPDGPCSATSPVGLLAPLP